MSTPPRITQTLVPPQFPEDGPIQAILFGEDPGPRGVDKSGAPFWGDRAGLLLYRGLWQMKAFRSIRVQGQGLFAEDEAEIPITSPPDQTQELRPWSGTRFAQENIRPVISVVAIWLLGDSMGLYEAHGVLFSALPHPAPQGILGMKRGRVPPMAVKELEALWLRMFLEAASPGAA